MKVQLLQKHIAHYKSWLAANPEEAKAEIKERAERRAFYQGWTQARLLKMTEDDFGEYFRRLWALMMWGNKQYGCSLMVRTNGLAHLRESLADLIWGDAPLARRWETFRKGVKHIGPAMMSELLCHAHPDECMLWNRRVYLGLKMLEVTDLPNRDYQLTGRKYEELCAVTREIAAEMRNAGIEDCDLLAANYLLTAQLQAEDVPSLALAPGVEGSQGAPLPEKIDKSTAEFIHNDVRDKLAEIGTWLGLNTDTEVKVADGAKLDASWEVTIGNMGRVIYVFEVQTKGSIDSMLMNLLRSLNNPAVQGAVAVSDAKQLEVIRKEAQGVAGLRDKLKYWDYQEVLAVHEALRSVNESINRLGLVPDSF